jgi:predicted dehydrogenase
MQVRSGNVRTQPRRGAGPLYDIGIYCLNAARYLFRTEPIEVAAMKLAGRDPRFAAVDEAFAVTLRFPQERVAQFTCSFGAYDHSSLTVVGEKGRLRLDPAYEYATGLTVETDIAGRKPQRKTFPKGDQIAAELVAFAACLRDGRAPEPSGAEGLADMRVVDAIARAAAGRSQSLAAATRRARPSKAQGIRRKPHGMPDLVNAESPGRD